MERRHTGAQRGIPPPIDLAQIVDSRARIPRARRGALEEPVPRLVTEKRRRRNGWTFLRACEAVVESVRAVGGRALGMELDVTRPASAELPSTPRLPSSADYASRSSRVNPAGVRTASWPRPSVSP